MTMIDDQFAEKNVPEARYVHNVAETTSRFCPLHLVHQGTYNVPSLTAFFFRAYPTIPRRDPIGNAFRLNHPLALADRSIDKGLVLCGGHIGELTLGRGYGVVFQHWIDADPSDTEVVKMRTDEGHRWMVSLPRMLHRNLRDNPVGLDDLKNIQSLDYGGHHRCPGPILLMHPAEYL